MLNAQSSRAHENESICCLSLVLPTLLPGSAHSLLLRTRRADEGEIPLPTVKSRRKVVRLVQSLRCLYAPFLCRQRWKRFQPVRNISKCCLIDAFFTHISSYTVETLAGPRRRQSRGGNHARIFDWDHSGCSPSLRKEYKCHANTCARELETTWATARERESGSNANR